MMIIVAANYTTQIKRANSLQFPFTFSLPLKKTAKILHTHKMNRNCVVFPSHNQLYLTIYISKHKIAIPFSLHDFTFFLTMSRRTSYETILKLDFSSFEELKLC